MNKKLLVSVFLCFFVFSFGMVADEKPKAKTIELLVWEEMGRYDDWILLWSPDDPLSLTNFDTGPFMRKSVPPSPESEMLFFEVQLNGNFRRQINATEFRFMCVNSWKIYSDEIPSNVEVLGGATLCNSTPENEIVTGGVQRRYAKVSMRRNSVDWWIVQYKDSEEMLPEGEAISILCSLIDNGFDIEFSYYGWVQGVEHVRLYPFWIEITRLSKN